MHIQTIRTSRTGQPLIENRHPIHAVLFDAASQKSHAFSGDPMTPLFLRSVAKPFQALPLLNHLESSKLSLPMVAIICASHGGDEIARALVEEVLRVGDIKLSALQCGPQRPLLRESANYLIRSATRPTPLHNNCSGKHAGMLMACKLYGWPMANYLDFDHPLQRQILGVIGTLTGLTGIQVAVDGCGAPVFHMPIASIAKLWSHMVTHPALARATQAFVTYPEIIGDVERIDTCLMKVSQGQLIAKVGAMGMLAVAHRELRQGFCIKMEDGSNEARERAAIEMLYLMDWLSEAARDELLAHKMFSPQIFNTQDKLVGHYVFCEK